MILRICALVLLLSTACSTLPPRGTAAGWKLLWEDDFGKQGSPDPAKWSFAGRKSPDWACYCADTSATTYVKNGRLYLKAMKNQDPTDTAAYKTACLHTRDKFSFTYGKIEVKARLPKGKGSWPAIWLMPQDSKYGGWPDSGEIDIMEHLNRDPVIYQTLHSHYVDKQKQKTKPVYFATTPFKEGEFNIFGLEWYPDRMDFFVNHRKTFSYPKTAGADYQQWPFDQAYYIILNQALGGNWVGSIDDRDLPVEMVVDWVRVYRKNDQ
jgi:beta-glucanase (GH16 family)